MTPSGSSLDTALSLWAVQRLSAASFRMRVRTFLALCLGVGVSVIVVAGAVAFTGVSGLLDVMSAKGDGEESVAWSVTLLAVGGLSYLSIGSVLREGFTRKRYAIPAAQVRGLWLALDVPLRYVVGVERGVEQVLRLAVGAAVIAGASTALATRGALLPAAVTACALAVLVAGEAACHVIALRNARNRLPRRVPFGLWETYLLGLGVPVGFGVTRVAELGRMTSAVADRASTATLATVATSVVLVGTVLAVVLVGALRPAWRAGHDVPLLGLDDPAAVMRRLTLWPTGRRSGPFGAVAAGTGSLTVQPAVLLTFRALLLAVGVAAGLAWSSGPVLRDAVVGPLVLAEAAPKAAVLLVGTLVSFASVVTLICAGHDTRLWHYRALWELGARPTTLWAAHVTGSAVQAVVLTLEVMLALWLLTGRLHLEVVAVALAVILSDHLAQSLLARPTRSEGDQRGTNAAPAVVGFVLEVPAVLAALAGGVWSGLLPVYVLLLAAGGLWCFTIRLKSLPVMAAQ